MIFVPNTNFLCLLFLHLSYKTLFPTGECEGGRNRGGGQGGEVFKIFSATCKSQEVCKTAITSRFSVLAASLAYRIFFAIRKGETLTVSCKNTVRQSNYPQEQHR